MSILDGSEVCQWCGVMLVISEVSSTGWQWSVPVVWCNASNITSQSVILGAGYNQRCCGVMQANAAGEPISVTHSRLPFNRNSTGCLLTISTFFCQAFVSECLAVTMTGVHCDSDWLWHSQVFISDSDRYLLATGTWRRQCDSCLPVTCAWLSFIDICVCVKCLSDRCFLH